MRISRDDAIKQTSLESVEHVECSSVEFTNRVTDGTHNQGMTEFASSTPFKDGYLTLYIYVNTETLDAVQDLDQIDWDEAMNTAEYEYC